MTINTKKIFISLIVMFTIFLSVVSFTACGKGNKNSKNNNNPEFIYQAKFKDIGSIAKDYISNTCITEDGVFMITPYYEYDKNDNLESVTSDFISCPLDGDKINTKKIKDLKKTESVNAFFTDSENNKIILTNITDYNDEKNMEKSENYMLNIDNEGKISNRIKIKPNLEKDEYFYPSRRNAAYIGDKLLIACDSNIYVFNKDGSQDKKIELENYIDAMFASGNGKVYILSYIETKNCICEVNMETGKLEKPADMGNHAIYDISSVKRIDNDNVYLSNYDGVFEFNCEKNKMEFLFDWTNVDIDNSTIVDFQPMKDGSISVITLDYDYSDSGEDISCDIELATINKMKYSDVKQKTRLTLASSNMEDMVRKEIIKFNKTSEDYHIEVANYSSYEDPQKQMNLDMISGKIPDIIDVSSLPKELYIKKGFLTDLYPLMEKDKDVNKEDLIDSVRSTIESNGKLYYIPMSFSIRAFMGSKKMFGDMEGWSYKDMKEKYDSMPEGGVFMNNMTREWFIQNMLGMQINDFVNFETGEVKLDSEEFIGILEFSKNFKSFEEYENEEYDEEWQSEDELARDGKLLLSQVFMTDLSDIQVYKLMYKKQGGFVVLSSPSSDKNNKIAFSSIGSCYSISEKCEDKMGAWNFIKRFYTYECQKKTGVWDLGFPIRKDVLEKKIEYAMATKEYTDDDGTKVKPISDYYSIGELDVEIKPYTKEEIDIFRSIIDRIGKDASYNAAANEITEMITEELEAFFIGDKTAKETAEILQSRVKIYVSENS